MRVNVGNGPPVGRGRGMVPYITPGTPWWPYYPRVYSPALFSWVDHELILHAEQERWAARRHQRDGDSPPGSVWEYPMGREPLGTSGC